MNEKCKDLWPKLLVTISSGSPHLPEWTDKLSNHLQNLDHRIKQRHERKWKRLSNESFTTMYCGDFLCDMLRQLHSQTNFITHNRRTQRTRKEVDNSFSIGNDIVNREFPVLTHPFLYPLVEVEEPGSDPTVLVEAASLGRDRESPGVVPYVSSPTVEDGELEVEHLESHHPVLSESVSQESPGVVPYASSPTVEDGELEVELLESHHPVLSAFVSQESPGESPSTLEFASPPSSSLSVPSPTATDETTGERLSGKFVSKNVCNLSNRVLSESEISVLSKGLKFCPTPKKLDRAQLKIDLEQFGRKMRLSWFYRHEPDNFAEYPIFKPKSTFNPKNVDAQIEFYLSRIEEEIMAIEAEGSNFSNLTQDEKQALTNLQNDPSIVIKEADKGSAVVVWDREDYLREAYSQLSDSQVYEECTVDPLPDLQNLISDTLDKIGKRGELSENTLSFLAQSENHLCRFFLVPKIHKRLFNVPGRPVVSNCGFLTENISAFLDHHLQPLAKKVKSYIKDTNHFLQKVRDLPDLPDNALLCTIDVTGLYPNIPHEEGLVALRNALNNRSSFPVSTESLVDLADLVLTNNFFEFDEKTFHQKQGTAIGTKFAPPYAVLFMSEFEEKALSNSPLAPWVWWRYIDDVFIIWEHGEEKLQEFLEYLNSIHPTIKFTHKYSQTSIEFLDVQVTKSGGRLKTDLYIKETDTHQYLHFTSCHPWHTKKGIPYSQALRIRRICSSDRDFFKRSKELKGWLLNRGFDSGLINEQVQRAEQLNRDTLLDKEFVQTNDNRINFVVTYHPAINTKLLQILRKNHYLLQSDAEHKYCFADVPRVAFRRPKNLKDTLVSARLSKPDQSQYGCYNNCPGCRSDCQVGQFLNNTKIFSKRNSNYRYTIRKGPLHCKSCLVVYLNTCKTCGIQYVGKSVPEFRFRLNNYKKDFRSFERESLRPENPKSTKNQISQASFFKHFMQEGHHGMEDWSFTLIDQAKSPEELVIKENFWQFQLNVFAPNGLNIRNAPVV